MKIPLDNNGELILKNLLNERALMVRPYVGAVNPDTKRIRCIIQGQCKKMPAGFQPVQFVTELHSF